MIDGLHRCELPCGVQEITRRVNLEGIWQAAYTAGVVLPKPVATCQYWHRSLNPKKLIAINFSRLAVWSFQLEHKHFICSWLKSFVQS